MWDPVPGGEWFRGFSETQRRVTARAAPVPVRGLVTLLPGLGVPVVSGSPAAELALPSDGAQPALSVWKLTLCLASAESRDSACALWRNCCCFGAATWRCLGVSLLHLSCEKRQLVGPLRRPAPLVILQASALPFPSCNAVLSSQRRHMLGGSCSGKTLRLSSTGPGATFKLHLSHACFSVHFPVCVYKPFAIR